MTLAPSHAGIPVPRWLVIVGSGVIAFHLSAVLCGVLAAPSGPWLTPDGGSMSTPPQFAFSLSQAGLSTYLQALKLTHNFHYHTNRPGLPAARLEIRLKDAAGQEVATIPLPDPKANPWVRHRQELLVQWLTNDQPVPPPQTEVIAAPGQRGPTLLIWSRPEEIDPKAAREERRLILHEVEQNQVPRTRLVMRPGDWAMLLVRSYVRHLCRKHGTAQAEVVRYSREAIPPAVLFVPDLPPGVFDDLVSNFGVISP